MASRRNLLKSALFLPFGADLFLRPAHAHQTATPTQPQWLKDIATQLQSEFHLPAVWVAANIEGTVEAAVVGVRKMGDPTPATLDDKLTVASISKTMVGLWIATLVDAGKVTYETKVLDVLPELTSACLPEHRDITLGQLLTHTAAVIRDVEPQPNNLSLEIYPAERLRQARVLLSKPSPPDSKGKELYSNNGVTLAATMTERVAGEPYETAAQRFYAERLNLKSWGVWADLHDDLTLPWPHTIKDNIPIPHSPRTMQSAFVRPSGSAHCTISDLVQFGLLATDCYPSSSILDLKTWSVILEHSKDKDSTTLGSFYAGGNLLLVFDHGGALSYGSRSHLRCLPNWKTSFGFHTNAFSDKSEEFVSRGIELLTGGVRKRRAELKPPPSCHISLAEVGPVDASWNNTVVPKSTDDKVRIRVDFQIETQQHTGDLQTLVKLGDVEKRDDRYQGLPSGHHTLHFEFDTPKSKSVPVTIKVDALETAGNLTPKNTQFETVLTLQ